LLLVAVAIVSCLLVVRSAALFGFSRLLVTYSLATGNLAAAKKAIQVTPKDAEAHVAGAAVMTSAGTLDQAVIELERAVALRPADYELWSQLGLLRDQTGDSTAALAAFDEAISRAPFYSEPRWNRGNVLLRMGQYEAAFNDLNQAAQSNPELIPNLIDLAWSISKSDVKLTEQLARIDSDKKRIAFVKLLARRGKAEEAVAKFGAAGNVSDDIKRELVEQLMARGAFKEAFAVWKVNRDLGTARNVEPSIYDGGFEGALAFAEGGFGWRVPRAQAGISISLDSSRPDSGSKDLRIEFGGESNPRVELAQIQA
jgi:tetratricopeptide (TPR) repeat protein